MEQVDLASQRGVEDVLFGLLEGGAGEDASLGAADALAADGLQAAGRRHLVGDEHDVALVDVEALLLEDAGGLVDDGVSGGLDAEGLIGLVDVVGGGARGVDALDAEDGAEVAALGVDDVFIVLSAHEGAGDALEPADALLLDFELELLQVAELVSLDAVGLGILFGLDELLEGLAGIVVVDVDDELLFLEVDAHGDEVLEEGLLELVGYLGGLPAGLVVFVVEVDGHDGVLGASLGVDDLDEAGEA